MLIEKMDNRLNSYPNNDLGISMKDARSTAFISVIIPIYNEAEHLQLVVARVESELKKTSHPYEIILVDDGSHDDTWAYVSDMARSNKALRAIRFSRNFGKEAALRAGIDAAKGEATITLDGDLQHPPELIHTLLECWVEDKADIIEAVKRDRNVDSKFAKLRAGVFYKIFSSLTGYELGGATDYKLLDKKVVLAMSGMPERGLFFRGMTAWVGFRSVGIPFDVAQRVGGKTRWPLLHLVRYAIKAITSFSSAPLYGIAIIGGLFFILSLAIGVKALYLWAIGESVTGYTTIIFLILVSGSCVMLGLAIIGQYLARIYEEIKFRPRYVVMDKVNMQEEQSPVQKLDR